jgi:excisionase family DNA binding protein
MVKTETAFLDLKEASQFLGVSEPTVLQLALEGTLPISTPPRSGIRILFLREDLLQFAEQNSEP